LWSLQQRAIKAGYQLIELHGAHGYLINEFLSQLANHTRDGVVVERVVLIGTGDAVQLIDSQPL